MAMNPELVVIPRQQLEATLSALEQAWTLLRQTMANGEPMELASEFSSFVEDFQRAVVQLWGKRGEWDEETLRRLYQLSNGDFLTVSVLLKKVAAYQKRPELSYLPRYLAAIFQKKGLLGLRQELGILDPPESKPAEPAPSEQTRPISFAWGKVEHRLPGNGTVVHLLNQVVEEAVRAYPNGR